MSIHVHEIIEGDLPLIDEEFDSFALEGELDFSESLVHHEMSDNELDFIQQH